MRDKMTHVVQFVMWREFIHVHWKINVAKSFDFYFPIKKKIISCVIHNKLTSSESRFKSKSMALNDKESFWLITSFPSLPPKPALLEQQQNMWLRKTNW